MKKIYILVLLCVICLSSCSNLKEKNETQSAQPKAEIIDTYAVLLYENSVGGVEDKTTDRYLGEKFGQVEIYKKKNKAKKNDEIFGKKSVISYTRTKKSDELTYEIDEYNYVVDRTFVFASYRCDTDKLVNYKCDGTYNRNFLSPVNPTSTQNEYLSYARNIFQEIASVSLDGWEVQVQTWREEYGYDNTFINYTHEIPEYNAEYIFTFYKKIGNVDRCDKMYIRMTNVGEIIEFNAINYDEAFKPYEGLQIDKEKIEKAVLDTFDVGVSIESRKINNIELVIKDKTLWAKVEINYSIGEVTGGVIYVVKVAGIQ